MPQQLSLDLPAKTALGRGDFFVSPSNAIAVAMIDNANDWPQRKLLLNGPDGAGKTHLTHVWAEQNNARIIAARDLAQTDIPDLASGPIAVEDVPEIAGDDAAQAALFHLHNLVLAQGHALLMTGRGAPRGWALSLPDLQSRVEGTQCITLPPPDDALLSAVLAKLFHDRQITPRPDVIPYLVLQIDRSFAAAAKIVDLLDQTALAEKRNVSRALAVRLLGESRETG